MKIYSLVAPCALILLISCTAQEAPVEAHTSIPEAIVLHPDIRPNVILKEYEDGTTHLLQERELNDNGDISVERRYISRPDESDSSGYYHDLWMEMRYVYDDSNQLAQVLDYRNTGDALILQGRTRYTYSGDTVISAFGYEGGHGEVIKKFIYDDLGRLIYEFELIGYDHAYVGGESRQFPEYISTATTYHGDFIQSVKLTNQTSGTTLIGDFEYPSNLIVVRTYRSPGVLHSDSLFAIDSRGRITDLTVRQYNEYGELSGLVNCDMGKGGRIGNCESRPYNLLENPRFSVYPKLDPMWEVRARLMDPVETYSNWEDKEGRDVLNSSYTYDEEGYILSRVDEFAESTIPTYFSSRTIAWEYDNQHHIIQENIEAIKVDGSSYHRVNTYERNSEGTLLEYTSYDADRIVDQLKVSPSGAIVSRLTSKLVYDTIVDATYYLSRRDNPFERDYHVNIRDGLYVQGYIVERDDAGRVTRVFDEEETGTDAQYVYDREGRMIRSRHSKVSLSIIPYRFSEREVYTLHYGEGYDADSMIESSFEF
ncbi:MAG: hypothetical protein HWD92_08030 [Flavobacteriia bacterium]|nr:hypothetical protein [Flavobacteriia bacterium]